MWNSTAWSYVAIIGALSNLVCAAVNSAIGVNPRPELVLVLMFVLIGAAASLYQTYRWRRPARKWNVVAMSINGSPEQCESSNFGDAMGFFMRRRDEGCYRYIQISDPRGLFFCWNHPDYIDQRDFGGPLGTKHPLYGANGAAQPVEGGSGFDSTRGGK